MMTDICVGQVWLYQRMDRSYSLAPVAHIITRVDGDILESTSVFTDDGKSQSCTLSGAGCGGVGFRYMKAGGDGAGTWTLLYSP